MGRISKKKVNSKKRTNSISGKCLNFGSGKKKRKSKANSNNFVRNIETKVASSTVAASNLTSNEIIDITNSSFVDNIHKNPKTICSKETNSDIENEIIDITETTYVNREDTTVFFNETNSYDDVQFISHITNVQNKSIEIVTISDDSDEENTPNQQLNEKPIGLISIKENLGISDHPVNTLKRKYNSPLRHRKKTLRDDVNNKPDFLLHNLGAFIIDKQRIPRQPQHVNELKINDTVPWQHIPSSSTTSVANLKLRPIIIDGLNIGHAHGCGTFSVKGIDICVQYFADRGHKDIIAFIPQHRQGPPGSESNTILNMLVKKGHICYTPSRKVQNLRMTCYDDRILLDYAHQCDGVVVSNDNYRDLYEESEAFKEIIENRQVMVTFVRDKIIVPEDQYNRRSNVRCLSDILSFPSKN